MTEITYRRAADLLEAELGAELVALDPQEGSCFGFNEVATLVWRQLERPKSFDELRLMLLAEYDVSTEQCTQELEALMADLVEKGLVSREPAILGESARRNEGLQSENLDPDADD